MHIEYIMTYQTLLNKHRNHTLLLFPDYRKRAIKAFGIESVLTVLGIVMVIWQKKIV